MLKRLSAQVSERLKRTGYGKGGKRVGLKVWRTKMDEEASRNSTWIGHGPCDVLSRMYALSRPTGKASDIFHAAKALLLEMRIPPAQIRGLGVVVGRLERSPIAPARGNVAMLIAKSSGPDAKRKQTASPPDETSLPSKMQRVADSQTEHHDCTSFQPQLLTIKTSMLKAAEVAACDPSLTENMFTLLLPKLTSAILGSRRLSCPCARGSDTCVIRWARIQAEIFLKWKRASDEWLAIVDEAVKRYYSY